MATLAATRCNRRIQVFYERLRGFGKSHKCALTACMRKFLIILNAMVRDHHPWQDDYAAAR
jgi:transposase